MILLLPLLLLFNSNLVEALFGYAQETSYSASFNKLALDLEDNFEANFAWTIKKKGKEDKEKFSNYTKLYPLIDSAQGKGEKLVQDDLDQLAHVYQTLNYSDMAALQLLRRSCLDDGLFHPKTDPVLCKDYPKQVIKSLEARIGMINSYILYSDDLLKVPTGWIEHAREILRLLELDRNGNIRAYVLQNMLLKAFKDRADGQAPEDNVPQPADSPLPFLSNTPRMMYTPGMQMDMKVTIAPQPYLNDDPPVVDPATRNYSSNTGQLGQPVQIINGQGSMSSTGAPCCGSSNVIAIPVMPISSLNSGTPIMGIKMNVPLAKSLNAGTSTEESSTLSSNTPSPVNEISPDSSTIPVTQPPKKTSFFSGLFKSSKPGTTSANSVTNASTSSPSPPPPPSPSPKKSSIFSMFGT
jgi:hypothetical protein